MSVSMCDNLGDDQALQPVVSNSGEIDHCLQLSEDVGALALNEEYSDVTFVVNSKSFPAHRVILAARCHYFRALLYGGMRESVPQATIHVDDTTSEAFQLLLTYIYTGKLNLSDLKEDLVIEILALSNKYGFTSLEDGVSSFLLKTLHIGNACDIYGVATLYSLKVLQEAASEFVDRNAIDILNGDSFLNLSLEAVKSIIERDSFCASERAIFKAVTAWWKHNVQQETTEEDKLIVNQSREQLLEGVRFHLMPLQELLHTVRPSGLISADDLLDAIQRQSDKSNTDLNYRGVLCPEENIATMQHGAQVVHGEMSAALLDGDTTNYDYEHGYTRHSIDDVTAGCKQEVGIVVKLGQPSIINCIRMLLWDKDTRSYSYYIEVSMDEKDWVRVVDHSKYFCRSWQYLHFSKRVVRFIRVVGTYNTVNKIFHLVSLEAMYTKKTEHVENGLIVPQVNVATVAYAASVIEGVSRDRNALLNGEVGSYDWDSGYTCHQLGNGAIVIQLNQPYQISTMRLLLWDIDERCYNYYIETSVNQNDWLKVVDNTKKECRSWQHLSFESRPVVFIRLVGTGNTANEVFHCVHFECPDSTAVDISQGATRSTDSVDQDMKEDLNVVDEAGADNTDELNSAHSDSSQQGDGANEEGCRLTRHSRRSTESFALNPQKPKGT